ncbi:hypothetical protein [Micromonospora sp. WMMD1082]|uniref:hypothetical protein n=1 Tax=Micromonospora sp. WMMD1082 TaxID=3016104 RepID=UPI0024171A61|nr:hypothetical protein [Micromonospora sp. WMMD1082]MDG4795445.1 hypothetical protein [Micromonospora sp. WMMD1082]
MKNASQSPEYVFCEPVSQTGTRSHLRRPDSAGAVFPHGGIPSGCRALCGLDVSRGWDTEPPVTAHAVRELLAITRQAKPGEGMICARCGEAYLETASA